MASAKRKVINANIILYGPPRAGKTSNIQFIHRKLKPSQRGQIVQLSQEGYPHVAYEFLPIELGELKGYDTNLYIYTSPSHDDGLETRLNLLNEAAGVVFIADSAPDRLDDNIEALTNLKEELRYWGIDYENFPLVFQFNKRDLPGALPKDELGLQLNQEGKESFDAIASAGQGVRDTFALISKMAVRRVRLKLIAEEEGGVVEPERRRPAGGDDDSLRRALQARRERMAPSDVTLDVAPPPRYDDEDAEESGVDELEVDDVDRRAPSTVAAAEESPIVRRDEDTTDHGVRRAAVSQPVAETQAETPEQSPAAAPAVEEPAQEEAPIVATDKGKRNQKRGGRKKEDVAVESARPGRIIDERAEEEIESSGEAASETSVSLRDVDFLKTSIPVADEEPMMIGTLEAAEADDGEVVMGGRDDLFGSGGLGTVSLPDAPSLGAISLAEVTDSEVNIQTYEEDEDEDEDEPIFRLGTRASEGEELLLEEEEMLLDEEEPKLDDGVTVEELMPESVEAVGAVDLAREEAQPAATGAVAAARDAGREAADADRAGAGAPEAGAWGETGQNEAPTPLGRASAFDDDDDDDDRSIIASQEELAAVGMNEYGERRLDDASMNALTALQAGWADDVPTRTRVIEEEPDEPEDEFIQSGRIEEEIVDRLPEVQAAPPFEEDPAATGGGDQASAVGSSGFNPEPLFARDSVEVADGDLYARSDRPELSDIFEGNVVGEPPSVAPESARTGAGADLVTPAEEDHLPDLAIAPLEEEAEKDGVFEMVNEESVFEAVVSGPPVETESAAARLSSAENGAATAAATTRGPIGDEVRGADAGPVVTGWGEISRIDDRTLRVPVSVKLPGSNQEVQLAVTLKVDLLVEGLLGAGRDAGIA